MFTKKLQKIISRRNLTFEEAKNLAESIIECVLNDIEIAAFLTALQTKGICSDELSGFVEAMKTKTLKISPKVPFCVDMCGTGGDGFDTFNISTTVAFVVAACGLHVAKHGNRSISSQSGSADVLKELGINIELPINKIEKSIAKIGIGFLFAPLFNPAFKNVSNVRSVLKIKTIFNLLGPLLNPASPKYQLIGVYDANLLEIYAGAVEKLNIENAMIVNGGGMDEISISTETKVIEIQNGNIFDYTIKPEDFGLQRASIEDLKGGNPKENAEILKNILTGKEKGAKRDIVLLNAAGVLKIAKKVPSWISGVEMAREAIESGMAWGKLRELRIELNIAA